MAQLSLEEFRRIKERLSEIAEIVNAIEYGNRELTEEEERVLTEELGTLNTTLHESDLSGIPFEEYEGFVDLGADFSGTGANLDYSLINMEFKYGEPVRAKGCSVRNFDFENLSFDDDSFDDSFKEEHQEYFLSRKDLPQEVVQRYYNRRLQIRDIIKYDLYDYVNRTPSYSSAELFFEKVTPDVARQIDRRIIDDEELWRKLEGRLLTHDVPVSIEEIEQDFRTIVEDELSSSYISQDMYDALVNNPKVHEMGLERKLIKFPEGEETLARDYRNGSLTLEQVFNKRAIFRNKDFVTRLSLYQNYYSNIPSVTEEQLMYLFDRFEDLTNSLLLEGSSVDVVEFASSINPEATVEENQKEIQSKVVEYLDSNKDELKYSPRLQKSLERFYSFDLLEKRLDENELADFRRIRKYATEEQIRSYGISPKLFEDSRILDFFTHYGFNTIMEFDQKNGHIFSKDDFKLARQMFNYYMHYGGNIHDEERTVFHRTDSEYEYGKPYSMEDFEECVKRMIVYGPTNSNYSREQPIDYRDFSEGFRTRYPDLFLPENAPEELKDKFYTKTLKVSEFAEHPEWIEYVENTNLFVGTRFPRFSFHAIGEDYSTNYFTFESVLKGIGATNAQMLDFVIKNQDTLKMLEQMSNYNHQVDAIVRNPNFGLEDFKESIEQLVEDGILSGRISYGDSPIPQFFKDRHPEYILDDNAPEELKIRFYPRSELSQIANLPDNITRLSFDIEDIANPEFRPFLEGKKFDLVKNPSVKDITRIFDIDTITKLYNIDGQALSVVYNLNKENLLALKELLDAGQFKAEDIMRYPGFFLNYPAEKRSNETLMQYKQLSNANMLKGSNNFARQTYEQILGHMLDFLGYEEAMKLLQVPEIDEETLAHIYAQDELIKTMYDKRFDVTGNIRVIAKLFEGVPGLLPENEKITSKNSCKIFQSINKRIQEGFNGDIRTMLIESMRENGFEVDDEKLNEVLNNVIDISTKQKLNQVREHNSNIIENNIDENQKTRNMIKMHYRNALEYSLKKSEVVDPILVREYLQNEFSKKRENGEPRYSPHVTDHLDDLVRFATELSKSPEWGRLLNHTVVDDLKEEASKIGKGWIRKITTNACYKLDKLSFEEASRLDRSIYPEGSDLEVDTEASIGIRELTEEEKKKLYELLTTENYSGFLTYAKAENMFSTMKVPQTDRFKEFFLGHKDEFLSNPDLFANFVVIASKFDEYLEDDIGFSTRFKEGTLEPSDILYKLSNDVYKNVVVHSGEHDLVYQAKSAGLTEEQVLIAQKLMTDMKQREYQTVPQEEASTKRYRGRIIRMDDPLHFAVGKITNCCQTIGKGEPGETSMIHSSMERNGSLFIVEELDEFGKPVGIVAQSWTWRNGNRVCFDNVEVPHSVEAELKKTGGFDEIMEVYQEAGQRMIEIDRLKLRKMVKEGKITEEQYQQMVIKDVAMGTGCDDLVHNLSEGKLSTIEKINAVAPLEIGKSYTGAHTRVLYSDAHNCRLIAHNDDFSEKDHSHTNIEVGDLGVKYTKTRDIIRRKGGDIDVDKIGAIADLVNRNGNEESSFSSKPISILEIASYYGDRRTTLPTSDKYRLSMSESADWYMLAEEQESGIAILESGIDLAKPETEIETLDRKMAIGEYTRELYKLIQEANSKGKNVILDKQTQDKFVNLEILVEDEIVSIQDGVIVVQDEEKLQEKIDNYDKVLDKQRRERLLLEAPPKEENVSQEENEL